ncbi:hypothetical protein JTB14_001058 [Gonioctena quinquepunctata]|nr:hypothetical protein JTB14_001058 [Gonioctena quinquepunctata]
MVELDGSDDSRYASESDADSHGTIELGEQKPPVIDSLEMQPIELDSDVMELFGLNQFPGSSEQKQHFSGLQNQFKIIPLVKFILDDENYRYNAIADIYYKYFFRKEANDRSDRVHTYDGSLQENAVSSSWVDVNYDPYDVVIIRGVPFERLIVKSHDSNDSENVSESHADSEPTIELGEQNPLDIDWVDELDPDEMELCGHN